jgi:hypothetical protein
MHPGHKRARRVACVVALTIAAATAARADEITTTISGYGTIGGTWTSDKNLAYHHSATEFSGASNQVDFPLDSRIGLQATITYGAQWSITAQELFKQRGNEALNPGTEWLYLQYTPDTSVKLRAGRVALGSFLFSDSREVGYAVPWFNAPNDMYAQEPFQSLDGMQALWSKPLGPVVLSLQASYGTGQSTSEIGGVPLASTAHDMFNGSIQVEYKSFLVRVAETQLHLPVSLPLSPTFTLNDTVADKFLSVGAQYDDGKVLVLGEWSRRQENRLAVVNETLTMGTNWYVGAGYRFGKFTPLVMAQNSSPLTSLTAEKASYNGFTAVLRYDVVQNIALKAQVTRVPAANFSYWIEPDFTPGKRVSIFSFGADFVF